MSETIEIGPIVVSIGPDSLQLRFADPQAALLEVPPGLEAQLRDLARQHAGQLGGKPVVIDLQGVEFVSSRHLGVVLTARRALAPESRPILTNITPAVSRILDLTSLSGYFTIRSDGSPEA
ncbi:MAG: STAS domain-containing protein [Phycisphaerae bacterium]